MRTALHFLFLSFSFTAIAQNVGINKTNPTQSLDVSGNANIDGKLMLNSTAGKAGQVLMTNSLGGTVWGYASDYKNAVTFTQNGTFNVPDTVTKVMIEAWGAGGGGAAGGGGGAGLYLVAVRDVTPLQVLTITIGTGGPGATGSTGYATSGTASSVTNGNFTVSAAGGSGATPSGSAYSSYYSAAGASFTEYPGENGENNTISYEQKNATTFAIVTKYGDGGAAAPYYASRSQGQTIITNENTGTVIQSNHSSYAHLPGGGGGGGFTYSSDGAAGMVIIRF